MIKHINFQGIGIEVGQSKRGLAQSAPVARAYLKEFTKNGLFIADQGDIFSPLTSDLNKVFSVADLRRTNWQAFTETYHKLKASYQDDTPLLNWGGDHSLAVATVGAFLACFPTGYVVWIDAHADLNLPMVSPTGHLHGMPVALLMNLYNIRQQNFPWLESQLDPQRIIYVGLRDLDFFEREMIRELGIKTITAHDIRNHGISYYAQEILEITRNNPLHVSFDIDSVDPQWAPSTGVPVTGGLTCRDLRTLGKKLGEHPQLKSVDMVELNPSLGSLDQVQETFHTAMIFLENIFIPTTGGPHADTRPPNQADISIEMESNL